MITERQIKARFSKPHLRKLVERMLKKDYYPWKNGKESDTPIKHYSLQRGVTIDYIIDRVRGYVWTSDTNNAARLYGEVKRTYRRDRPEDWVKYNNFLRMRRIDGTTPQAFEILDHYDRTKFKTDAEIIDVWIEGHLLDSECFVNNNTAIDIYIPWNR